MPSWVQCRKTGKFIPKEEYQRHDPDAPFIHGDFKSFVSPVDGTLIDDRGKLRRHNKRHGVTHSSDYSEKYIADRAADREAQGKRELKQSRLNDIYEAIGRHGG